MKSALLDVSKKLDQPLFLDLYAHVDEAARALGIDWVVVGATARDLIYETAFGIRFGRATRDIDFGIDVASDTQFEELAQSLQRSGRFQRQGDTQKFIFTPSNLPMEIDIVPFGGIENPDGKISFPPSHHTLMTVTGFREALASAVRCRLRAEPELIVKVTHPAMLVLLKLFAWQDRRLDKNTDAGDAAQAMSKYVKLDNDHRVYDEPELFDDDFDRDTIGARLVGRDIAERTGSNVRGKLEALLDEQIALGDSSTLLGDMMRSQPRIFVRDDAYAQLMRQLLRGLRDRKGTVA